MDAEIIERFACMAFDRIDALESEFLERTKRVPNLYDNRLARKLKMLTREDIAFMHILTLEINKTDNGVVSVENDHFAAR